MLWNLHQNSEKRVNYWISLSKLQVSREEFKVELLFKQFILPSNHENGKTRRKGLVIKNLISNKINPYQVGVNP